MGFEKVWGVQIKKATSLQDHLLNCRKDSEPLVLDIADTVLAVYSASKIKVAKGKTD